MRTSSVAGLVLFALALVGSTTPSMAWQSTSRWGYQAVQECPMADVFCVVVSCPQQGRPSLEFMMYEHGHVPGDALLLRIDGGEHRLIMPEAGAQGLYSWPLTDALANDLKRGNAAGLVVDPATAPIPISLAGSGKAIQRILQSCGTGGTSPTAAAKATASKAALTGLSDNTGCAEARSEGVVVSRELAAGGREVEGFFFKDDRYDQSYINVSLPEAMSRSRKAATQARLLEVVQPGARLRMVVQGCGAGARIEVVSSITPL